MNLGRNQAENLLQRYFKLNSFYKEQWETIENLLNGQRILLIQRTGFGKSLCYQFPAILFDGTTIVFSPLIALMRDQVQQLKSLGISAECINSEQSKQENYLILEQAKQNRIKILYVAPERQESLTWLEAVKKLKLSMVVIDEAHCISVWGHDFRPAFRKIIELVKLLPQNFPVLATTATATERVAQDIIQQMGGGVKYLRGNLMRHNFYLKVVNVASEDDKLAYLAQVLQHELDGTGIVYSGTRVNTEIYSRFLNYQGIEAINYNAGFDADTRKDIEQGLNNNRWKCVVSTNALGMGIDKPDLRFVIHTQIPASPIHYYQEIGRAGRDGKDAQIILLYNPQDRELPQHFIETSRPPLEHYYRVIKQLKSEPLSRGELMRRTNLARTKIEVIIADLIDRRVITEVIQPRAKKYEYQFDAPPLDVAAFEQLRQFKLEELEKMIEYAETDRCRMLYLRHYLEDRDIGDCHKCDNCQSRKLIYDINHYWQQRVEDFKNNYFPEIEVVKVSRQDRAISERRSKLVNGVAFSYYGFSNVGATIHHCKYENGGYFPDYLLNGVVRAYRSYFKGERFDLIIYVPPTESGDLVQDFAQRIANILKIPLSHGLIKTRDTKPQKVFQNSALKRGNLKGAFNYNNTAEVRGKDVLLIDDVGDSLATIREIGSLMSRLGVNKIAPLVIARTIGGDIVDGSPDFSRRSGASSNSVPLPQKSTVKTREDKPFAQIRQTYPRAYEKWTKQEDELLIRKFYQGESVVKLANYFQRKEGAIRSRLRRFVAESEVSEV
ncbi:MAG: RecQ family ATP-dependent DNA helicase [Chloroflexi bacterium CG08_land_8_20_14_0_20_45_12]|nr:MAG: RecQ family ATP-dependent DNA helicase [Chloroflexi bacterium CG08_land_8_20_14_0_20_45_12]PIX27768.1 MAG: RecQ family ATP-dependent DNA helicase [Chloroflexi bacterium CG_4_8_14_3_um_filter_45_15]